MINKKRKNNRDANQFSDEVNQLSDEEIETVNGGMKIVVEDEPSWFQTIVDFFFKINK